MDVYCIQNIPGEYWYVRLRFITSSDTPGFWRCVRPRNNPKIVAPNWSEFYLRELKHGSRPVRMVEHRSKSGLVVYQVDKPQWSFPFIFVSDFSAAEWITSSLRLGFQAGRRLMYHSIGNIVCEAVDNAIEGLKPE